jgi:hypothetical protein
MRVNFKLGLVASVLLACSGPASAAVEAGGSYTLHLRVAIDCTVKLKPIAAAAFDQNASTLGEIDEYCNAATGYKLIVSYSPGTLRGSIVALGEDRVVLNGSGEAVVSNAAGPRIRARVLTAIPGANGFDTDHLDFRIQPV